MTTQSLRMGVVFDSNWRERFNDLEKLRKQPVASSPECGAGKIIKIPLQRNLGLVNPREVTKLLIWWQKFGDLACRACFGRGVTERAAHKQRVGFHYSKIACRSEIGRVEENKINFNPWRSSLHTFVSITGGGAIKFVRSAERDDENTCASLSLCSRSRTLPHKKPRIGYSLKY